MMIVIPWCHKDADGTLNLLHWMRELDGQSRHSCLLVAAAGLPKEKIGALVEAARAAFQNVIPVQTTMIDNRPWPCGPNTMFRCTLGWAKQHLPGRYFWWNEPDCIPLVPGWADALEAEYLFAKRPFMGVMADLPTPHLTGCAMYPSNVAFYNKEMTLADRKAFDCVEPLKTLAFTHHTTLVHHQWNDWDGSTVPSFQSVDKLKLLRPGAVIFHRCKDQSLVERLRERRAKLAEPSKPPSLAARAVSFVRERVAPEPKPSDASKPIVYTYYDRLTGLSPANGLLDFWQEKWAAQGWQPLVLSEKDAKRVPGYVKFLSAIHRLPTVNHRGYEDACYLRHLAMVHRGGGFLTDYDVLPVNCPPPICSGEATRILEPTRVPCAVVATRDGYGELARLFTEYQPTDADVYNGAPHVSDMTIIRQSQIPVIPLCVEYLCSGSTQRDDPGEGWRTAAMIHFSTGSLTKRGFTASDKVKVIKEVLEELSKTLP